MKLVIFIASFIIASNLSALNYTVSIDILYSKEYKQCEQSATSEYDVTRCLDKEIKKQDKSLNQAYKKAMKSIQKFRKNDLKNIQRLWIKYTDAKCNALYHKESGSSGLSNATQCKLDEIIYRTLELKNHY